MNSLISLLQSDILSSKVEKCIASYINSNKISECARKDI